MPIVEQVVPGRDRSPGSSGRGQAARHVADERDAVRAEVEERRGEQPADDEHERARDRRRGEPQRRGSRASATSPTSSVVQWIVAERLGSTIASSRHALSPSDDVPVSFGSSPIDDVDRGAREEAGDDRLREELRDPAQPEERRAAGTARR